MTYCDECGHRIENSYISGKILAIPHSCLSHLKEEIEELEGKLESLRDELWDLRGLVYKMDGRDS